MKSSDVQNNAQEMKQKDRFLGTATRMTIFPFWIRCYNVHNINA